MRTGALLLAALTLAAGTRPAAAGRFEVQRLAVEGDVLGLVPADLDGDGHLDLLVAYRSGLPPQQKRFFALFWNQGRRFAARPDLIIAADAGAACAFDVADVDGVPGAELLIVTPSGVEARSLRRRQVGAPAKLIAVATLFLQPVQGELARIGLAQELTTPGANDLLVPTLGGLEIYRRQGGAYARAAHLAVTLDARARGIPRGRPRAGGGGGPINVSYGFPALTVADTDGDGRKDVVTSLEDRLDIYRQGPPGAFAEQPTTRRAFGVRTPSELTEMSSYAAITVTDIDGDGLADVVVRKQVSRGISSATATSFVYFARRGTGYPARPDQVIRSEGASGTEVELQDVTGDGRTDLVVPSVNIGILAVIRILTTKTLKVNFQVFPFDPGRRRFAERPAAERELKFRLSLSGEAGVQAADMRGDYNGDRRPDLVFGTDDDELSLFPGTGGATLFAEDALEQIQVPAFGTLEAVDLDRQGKSDMVLFYPNTKGQKSQLVVLLNRGPW